MAKFKIGDKVIVARHGQKGKIVSGPHDYGGSLVVYGIDLDNGKHTQETEGSIKAANSASVATNYNPFFVGDVVTYSDAPGKRFKVRKCGTDWCKINEIDSSGKYVKGEYGLDYDAYVVSVGRIHKINNSAPASTNPVVQNALNSTVARNGYVVLRGVKGGTVKVFEGDSVNWRGREFIAKRVGSPELTKMVIDDDGETYTVDMRDPQLKGYNSTVARNDAVLADYKKFVKAQMAAALQTLENARRDIAAQGETSAKTAKATSSTDEHEIIRDYSGKTAKAIDEAISKLKSAKENPLIL